MGKLPKCPLCEVYAECTPVMLQDMRELIMCAECEASYDVIHEHCSDCQVFLPCTLWQRDCLPSIRLCDGCSQDRYEEQQDEEDVWNGDLDYGGNNKN